jgi:hypothetical protein
MMTSYEFRPRRTAGMIFHLGAIAILAAFAAWGLWQASLTDNGLVFVLSLIPALIAVSLVPLLAYRLQALRGAFYLLERDGIKLRWGLRSEEIPIDSVLWVRPAAELGDNLPLPWLRWPGAVIGTHRQAKGAPVEFMASETGQLVLIATPKGLYAISPDDPAAFLSTYHRLTELGSISPLKARSVYPTNLLARLWRRRTARYLLLAGLAINLLLLAWVILVAPMRGEVILGYQRGGKPLPAIQLLLLPVLSSVFFILDFVGGLFFFRRGVLLLATPAGAGTPRAPNMVLAYLLWSSGLITALLFFAAVAYVLLS